MVSELRPFLELPVLSLVRIIHPSHLKSDTNRCAQKGITYKDITLSKIAKYGIVIEQDYENGSPTGSPTTGVPITNLTLSNIKGSVTSSGTNIYLLCGKGSCSDWTFSSIVVTGGKTSTKCSNIPSGSGATC